MSPDVERLRPLVTEAILWSYIGGYERYETSDLVVYLVLGDESLPRVFVRSAWLENTPEVAPSVREKLSEPASKTTPLEGTQTAFWFVARFPDGDMAAMTIISQRMQDGGDA